MRRRWRKREKRESAELNITAFMNLMVILVPFLLITAVFSRIAILELNLPGASSQESSAKEKLELEVTIRGSALVVSDRMGGTIRRIARTEDDEDIESLSELLQKVKARYPDKKDITILVEPNVAYEVLVEVMDAARIAKQIQDGEMVNAELFPEISIGDAVMKTSAARPQE